MAGRLLLDSNAVIALLNREPTFHRVISAGDEVFVPAIVLGELYYGALKAGRSVENLSRIDRFARISAIVSCDRDVAREYGLVRNSLRLKGTPIPDNDIWIAATARRHDLTIVSKDAHFDEVDGLRRKRW